MKPAVCREIENEVLTLARSARMKIKIMVQKYKEALIE
jgi:hypothetical protein